MSLDHSSKRYGITYVILFHQQVYGEGSPVIQPHPNPPGELCNSQQDPLTHVVCVDNESLHSNPSSGVHQYPTPFIKQEHGLYHLPTSYFNHEQYHYSTPFIKQEPGVRQQFPSLSSSVPFPPHSIDLNYLSDIEDIITPISSRM